MRDESHLFDKHFPFIYAIAVAFRGEINTHKWLSAIFLLVEVEFNFFHSSLRRQNAFFTIAVLDLRFASRNKRRHYFDFALSQHWRVGKKLKAGRHSNSMERRNIYTIKAVAKEEVMMCCIWCRMRTSIIMNGVRAYTYAHDAGTQQTRCVTFCSFRKKALRPRAPHNKVTTTNSELMDYIITAPLWCGHYN